MKEIIRMWDYTQMIMLTAVAAAVYAAAVIPFKGLVIIPGFATIRPGNVFPIIFGLMFGPAGAWGSGLGNLISDVIGGTLNPSSLFGFLGNFALGLVSYKLWGNLGILSSDNEPDLHKRKGRQLIEFWTVAAIASIVGAAIIGWGVALLELFPFSVFTTIVLLNNFLASALLGPPLLYLTYPRVKGMNLLYPDIMHDDDLVTSSSYRSKAATYGTAVVALVWLLAGMLIGTAIQGNPLDATLGSSEITQTDSTYQILLGGVCIALIGLFIRYSRERLPELVRQV